MAYIARMLLAFLSTFIICQVLIAQGVTNVAVWITVVVYGLIQYFIGFWAAKDG